MLISQLNKKPKPLDDLQKAFVALKAQVPDPLPENFDRAPILEEVFDILRQIALHGPNGGELTADVTKFAVALLPGTAQGHARKLFDAAAARLTERVVSDGAMLASEPRRFR